MRSCLTTIGLLVVLAWAWRHLGLGSWAAQRAPEAVPTAIAVVRGHALPTTTAYLEVEEVVSPTRIRLRRDGRVIEVTAAGLRAPQACRARATRLAARLLGDRVALSPERGGYYLVRPDGHLYQLDALAQGAATYREDTRLRLHPLLASAQAVGRATGRGVWAADCQR